jgi:hypothetical protein
LQLDIPQLGKHRHFINAAIAMDQFISPQSLLRLAAACLFALVCSLKTQAQLLDNPAIQFTTTEHDLGRLLSGSVVKHDFIFTNTGKANLSVTNVLSSCGCITSTNWSREIPPGQQGRIPFSFNSTGMVGDLHRTLSISTNDPTQPSVMLIIKGTVWQKIQLTPPTALIAFPKDDTKHRPATIIITNHTDQPLNLQAPTCNLSQINVRLETIKPGQEFKLIVDTAPPFPQSTLRGLITIGTTSTEVPVLNIPVTALVPPIKTSVPSPAK